MLKDITINTEKLMTLIKDIYDTFDYLEKDNEKENLKWMTLLRNFISGERIRSKKKEKNM